VDFFGLSIVNFFHLRSLAAKLGHVLIVYGAWGLFSISFLDSSFMSFPVFNDLALILLAGQHPGRAVFYALGSTAGSVLGCYLLYAISRRGGEYLWRKAPPRAIIRAERWLQRNDFVALLVASLLPPPAPLKIFVLTAGVLQVNPLHFALAMLIGRGLRFGADAWLGARYGAQAQAYLKENLGWASLAAVAIIVGCAMAYRAWTRRRAEHSPSPPSGNSLSD
jgi:membrane protein YqaA with SNARE-associated domain